MIVSNQWFKIRRKGNERVFVSAHYNPSPWTQ